MTFDTLKLTTRRQEFTAIEIVLDKNDPALDATFALEPDSFGTPRTTENALAFTGTDFRTYRYSDQELFGVDHFPNLVKVSSNPAKIDPGVSIGFRATASATIKDFIDGDEFSLPSPYDGRRVSGSHFLKLLVRNHVKNRRVRILRGYEPFNYDESNCQIENYIIDEITPPSENGDVTIKMIDELILVEEKKAKAPLVSAGELSAVLLISGTTLIFTSTVIDEYGAVSATGSVSVEKEIMTYVVATSTTLTVVRAQNGTEAKEHAIGETVQKCIVFDNINIIDIFTDLITDYTKIPTSYIPTADWAALKSGDLSTFNLTRTLYKPFDIKKLFNQLVALAGLSVYIDVIGQKMRIVTIPDFATPVITFDETEHLVRGKVKAPFNEKKQITRQTVIWDKFDATESDDEKNYRKKFQVIDGFVEADSGNSNVSEGKLLKSDWIINSIEDTQIATNYAQRQVSRFSATPRSINLSIDQAYIGTVTSGDFCLGSIFAINTSKIVDSRLANVTTTCQCIQLKASATKGMWDVAGLSFIAAVPPNADLFIDVDKENYLLTDELTTTESREYVVVINSGVTISSSITTTAAFSQGVFANPSATLSLVILGRIIGAGGAGGQGGGAISFPPPCNLINPAAQDGADAGDALDLTTNTTIDNGFGLIAAGGGGGAGFSGLCPAVTGGQGGGGGAGEIGGGGGAAGVGDNGNGAVGVDGTIAGPGLNGGDLGGSGGNNSPATGGSAGNAINKNGNTVTITSGNNSLQIKGAVT